MSLSFVKKEEDKIKAAVQDAARWVLEEMINAAEHLDKQGAKFCADTEAKLEAAYAALEAEKAGTVAPTVEPVAPTTEPLPPALSA
jgi:vacuolar-type H+-ATPase subunit E/Vma4